MSRIKVEKEVCCTNCGSPLAVVLELYDCSPEDIQINAKCTKCNCISKMNKSNLLVLPKEPLENDDDDEEEEGEMDKETQEKKEGIIKPHVMKNDNLRYFG